MGKGVVWCGVVWCGGVGVEWVGGWSGMVRTSLSSECASSTLSSPWYITHGVHVVMPGRRMRPGKDDDTSTSSRFPAFLSTHTCTQGGQHEERGTMQCSRQRRNTLYTQDMQSKGDGSAPCQCQHACERRTQAWKAQQRVGHTVEAAPRRPLRFGRGRRCT